MLGLDWFRKGGQSLLRSAETIKTAKSLSGRVSSRSDVSDWANQSYFPRNIREYHYKNLEDIESWTTETLLQLLIDINPEASHAIANYLRVFDSGMDVDVLFADGSPNKRGDAALQDMLNRLKTRPLDRYVHPRGIKHLSLKLALDGILKGAISCEAVFNRNYELEEIAYVDPWTVHFKWEDNRIKPYQKLAGAGGGDVDLDIPTFFYFPIDPLGDEVYGRSQLISAIRPIAFKTRVMQDLQRVIHNQGFPRIDIKLMEEILIKNAPVEIKRDAKKLTDYLNSHMTAIKEDYRNLKPDDHMVHYDSVELSYLEASGSGARSMFSPKELIDVIDGQVINGLKSMATLLSKRFGGSTEGYTSVEATVFIKLIQGFQSIVQEVYDQVLTLGIKIEHGLLTSRVKSEFREPHLRPVIDTASLKSNELSNLERTPLTDDEYKKETRKLMGFRGDPPAGAKLHLNDETGNDSQPNRPPTSEKDKEKKKKETNRKRRSGQGDK